MGRAAPAPARRARQRRSDRAGDRSRRGVRRLAPLPRGARRAAARPSSSSRTSTGPTTGCSTSSTPSSTGSTACRSSSSARRGPSCSSAARAGVEASGTRPPSRSRRWRRGHGSPRSPRSSARRCSPAERRPRSSSGRPGTRSTPRSSRGCSRRAASSTAAPETRAGHRRCADRPPPAEEKELAPAGGRAREGLLVGRARGALGSRRRGSCEEALHASSGRSSSAASIGRPSPAQRSTCSSTRSCAMPRTARFRARREPHVTSLPPTGSSRFPTIARTIAQRSLAHHYADGDRAIPRGGRGRLRLVPARASGRCGRRESARCCSARLAAAHDLLRRGCASSTRRRGADRRAPASRPARALRVRRTEERRARRARSRRSRAGRSRAAPPQAAVMRGDSSGSAATRRARSCTSIARAALVDGRAAVTREKQYVARAAWRAFALARRTLRRGAGARRAGDRAWREELGDDELLGDALNTRGDRCVLARGPADGVDDLERSARARAAQRLVPAGRAYDRTWDRVLDDTRRPALARERSRRGGARVRERRSADVQTALVHAATSRT